MIRVSLPRTVARVIPLSLLLPILALGCSRDQGAKATPDGSKAQTIAVTVAPVEARDVQRRVEIVGSIEPDEEVTVYAQVSGYVEKILADLGDRVNAGQPLIQLDQADFRL
ncbi:MAG: putative Macrolide-specific efflux protein macA precursor, partial [candidate division NC10 bacterium]|nr:putative Macrolide-specific efflux protein macA precursor [candidate division NC10 bacterium]